MYRGAPLSSAEFSTGSSGVGVMLRESADGLKQETLEFYANHGAYKACFKERHCTCNRGIASEVDSYG